MPLFRERLLRRLRRALARGRLAGHVPAAEARARLERSERRPRWEGRSFRRRDLVDSRQVFGYLGRYAAGMVIHAGRILEWDDERRLVTISLGLKPRLGGSGQVLVLTLEDFARRFAQHVLPARFQRIRHVGLYASHPACRARLHAARALLPSEAPADPELVAPGHELGDDWEEDHEGGDHEGQDHESQEQGGSTTGPASGATTAAPPTAGDRAWRSPSAPRRCAPSWPARSTRARSCAPGSTARAIPPPSRSGGHDRALPALPRSRRDQADGGTPAGGSGVSI